MKHAWLTGFAIGPSFTYLCWAITAQRPTHIALALSLNVLLWIGGPAFLAHVM